MRRRLAAGGIAGLATGLWAAPVRAASERASYVQLFGPVQNEGLLEQIAPTTYGFPGAATSTSFKKFWFNRAWKSVTWAALRLEWRPATASDGIRLIQCDDGVANIRQICEVLASDLPAGRIGDPCVGAVDITAAVQALGAAGLPKNLGWQIKGDGTRVLQVYQVYLEILES